MTSAVATSLASSRGFSRKSRGYLLHLVEDFRRDRVDYDAGLIRGVKVCGLESVNGIEDMPEVEKRVYTREALKRAIPLYENAPVNVDHPESPQDRRTVGDRFGKLVRVRLEEDGLYADLVFNRKHRLARQICEAADRMPDTLGLSHNADARGERRGNAFVVTEITTVRGVDVVSDPATTQGLFEGRSMATTKKRTKRLTEAELRARAAKLLEEDGELDEEEDDLAGLGLDDEETEEEVPEEDELPDEEEPDEEEITDMEEDDLEGGDLTAEPSWRDHLADMFSALIRDETLSKAEVREKLTKAVELLGEDEVAAEMPMAEEEEDEEDDEEVVPESTLYRSHPGVRQLLEKLDYYQTKEKLNAKKVKAMRLCEQARLPRLAITKTFLEQLLHAKGERQMKALVEDRRRTLLLGKKPRSRSAGGTGTEMAAKDFAQAVKRGQAN